MRVIAVRIVGVIQKFVSAIATSGLQITTATVIATVKIFKILKSRGKKQR